RPRRSPPSNACWPRTSSASARSRHKPGCRRSPPNHGAIGARVGCRYATWKKGRVLVGFREEQNPRFVTEIRQCEVMHPALGPKVGLLAELLGTMDAAEDIPQIEFAA